LLKQKAMRKRIKKFSNQIIALWMPGNFAHEKQ
jgi:hypothetical protein